MKFQLFVSSLVLLGGLSGCANEAFEEPVLVPVAQPYNQSHPKAAAIQAIVDEYTAQGLPGVVVAIKDRHGVWEGASGFAKVETNLPMTTGLVHTGGSVTKTYAAAAILKLQEQGLLHLDQPISQYLPPSVSSRLTRPGEVTVRMLLNHTSGIPDYVENSGFKLRWFNNLPQGWSVEEALAYAYHKPLLFNPGSAFSYSNTNYLLLSLMIGHLTGQPEGEWLAQNILQPLGLQHTYYKSQAAYLDRLPLPNYYLDRYGDGRLQNVTVPAKTEIRSELGDGGLVATAQDFVSFMHALVQGQVVSAQSYAAMKTPTFNGYGLGVDMYTFEGKKGFGHSGAILGGSALLLYLEDTETTVFIGCNSDGDLVTGKTFFLYHAMKNKVCEYLLTEP